MRDGRPTPKNRVININIVFMIALSLNFCSPCLAQENKEAKQEIDDFSLIQYEDGGEKKWELNGKSAEVEDNNVKIEDISAVSFGEETSFKLKAREGDFDREENLVHLEDNVVVKTTDGTALTTDSLDWHTETKNVFTDEHVTIKKADFQVNGKGIEADLEAKTAELKKDITADIKAALPSYLATSDKRQGTTIKCDGPLELNYKKNKATFLNNVEVEDSEGNILADRIDVYFSKDTSRIRCVVARGNVRIVNGENVTYSEKAIYLVDQGRVVLPNRPKLVIQSEAPKK